MNSKELLLSDEALKNWWSGIVGDVKFDKMMLILKAATFEGSPSPEQTAGITKFIESMLSIANKDAAPVAFSQPGLKHNLEPKSRTLKPKAK